MRSDLRLLWLSTAARLRTAGPAPWLTFVAWLLVAGLQEPRLLRGYGIHLLGDAAWSGGLVVLLVVTLAERRLPRRRALLGHWLILVGVAVLQAAGSGAIDLARGPSDPLRHVAGAGLFVLAWTPLSLTLAAGPVGQRRSTAFVVTAAFLLGCTNSVALRSLQDPVPVLASCLLAALGGLAWSWPRTT